ncbi:hypothetical protein ATANTOWER_031789 [Ataeniobius toweri]|uniref:Uncharacterized protein n=1 Tax=Ataeniobius toweri TaxID=208326 RepID=A0ABU7AL14_9TELE|nr:hypothetical protein [Ataeniobius toweri]
MTKSPERRYCFADLTDDPLLRPLQHPDCLQQAWTRLPSARPRDDILLQPSALGSETGRVTLGMHMCLFVKEHLPYIILQS